VSFQIWKHRWDHTRDADLMTVENFGSPELFDKGLPLIGKLPKKVVLTMDEEYKKAVRLIDSVSNHLDGLILSRPFMDFLATKKLKDLELIPVAIRNHKGKIASEDYTWVNPLGGHDILDIDRCEPQFMYDTMVISVERFVERRDAKVPPGVGIFRDRRFGSPIFVEPSLAKEIEAKGFKGFFFKSTVSE